MFKIDTQRKFSVSIVLGSVDAIEATDESPAVDAVEGTEITLHFKKKGMVATQEFFSNVAGLDEIQMLTRKLYEELEAVDGICDETGAAITLENDDVKTAVWESLWVNDELKRRTYLAYQGNTAKNLKTGA
jgi:hypothetical protein